MYPEERASSRHYVNRCFLWLFHERAYDSHSVKKASIQLFCGGFTEEWVLVHSSIILPLLVANRQHTKACGAAKRRLLLERYFNSEAAPFLERRYAFPVSQGSLTFFLALSSPHLA